MQKVNLLKYDWTHKFHYEIMANQKLPNNFSFGKSFLSRHMLAWPEDFTSFGIGLSIFVSLIFDKWYNQWKHRKLPSERPNSLFSLFTMVLGKMCPQLMILNGFSISFCVETR